MIEIPIEALVEWIVYGGLILILLIYWLLITIAAFSDCFTSNYRYVQGSHSHSSQR